MNKLLIFLLLTSPCFATGPKFGPHYDTARINLEFQNVYQDIRNPDINVGTASTMTITQLNVSTITFRDGTTLTSSSQTVVQRWYTKVNGTGQTTGTTYLDTGLSVTTGVLKKASNYLVVRFFEPAYASNAVCRIQTSCAGTVLGTTMGSYSNATVANVTGGGAGGIYRYYPNSTSAVTCKTQYSSSSAGNVAGIGGDGSTGYDSTMEIEEIAQ